MIRELRASARWSKDHRVPYFAGGCSAGDRAMQMQDVLREPQASAQIDALAKAFDIDRAEVEAVITSVVPEISRRLERQTLSRGGLADVVSLLGSAQSAPARIGSPEGEAQGNALLAQVLGSKDASRALAARAAASSGLGETLIKAMLPFIISMIMNALSRKASGGLGDILSKLPQAGGSASQAPAQPPPPAPRPAPAPTAGSSPLPGPEGMELPSSGSNPYGDLSDIIRRGGGGGGAGGGGSLWSVVRGILGGILGFQSRGIVGWLFRLIVMRWGWQLLTRVLGRVLTGR